MPRKYSKREVLLNVDDVRWFFKECPNESLSETMRRLLSAYRKECTYNSPRERIEQAAINATSRLRGTA